MTSVGHSIVGASFGVASLPVSASRRYKFLNLAVFSLLANFPDIPVPYWGHDFYHLSHSLLVNLALIVLAAIALLQFPKIKELPEIRRLIILAACAWLSHLLLDTFYNHGRGLEIFWPLSRASLAIPIPWFSVLPMEPSHNIAKILRIFLLELLSYTPLLFFSISLRNWQKTGFRARVHLPGYKRNGYGG